MAIKKNLVSDRDEYTRYLGNFRGVDFSSDPSEVHDSRFSECVNMYKDYRSGQGQAIETIPGFREIVSELEGEIYGIHPFEGMIFVHAGTGLYCINKEYEVIQFQKGFNICKMNERKSTSFIFNNSLYILDGENYVKCVLDPNFVKKGYGWADLSLDKCDETGFPYTEHVNDSAFVPVTHISLTADGGAQLDENLKIIKSTGEYAQQNILTDRYKATFVCDGESKQYCLPLGCDKGETRSKETEYYYYMRYENESGTYYRKITGLHYSHKTTDFEISLYGVVIPHVANDGSVPYEINRKKFLTNEFGDKYLYYHERTNKFEVYEEASDGGIYVGDNENAYLCIDSEGCTKYPTAIISISEEGVISFTDAPPRPEDNRYGGDPLKSGEGFAYPEGYAGLEVTAKKAVRTIKGITATDSNVGSIITGCNIATVHDGRVFLSGNPQFPNFVFYNGINPETGYSDPSYFGVLNWFSEGVGSAPITGLMPISNALMVLRRDTVQDGSVTFRYRHETGEDVMPVTYTADEGLPGVGCLGACCNFLDDPIFISKYGVEAMGQLSTRLERAIEHRSSLIDGLLLNLDLSKASITEYGGYLVLLIEGKIFLADSRQRYTHESGVMQYEWFYLDDIGIYEGQTEEYKYAEFPHEVAGEKIEIKEGDETVNIIEAPSELIGTVYDGNALSVSVEDETVYYAEYTYLDGGNNSVTARYYLEPTGAMTGGTFDPAVIIKAIGDDLYFGTRGGRIGKFYFDKRDPLDDYKIPTEYYTFNGRTIRSCCVTKMDNCGVPHLNKSTVKKSMVVKMRTFPKSAVKIKVRTNRRNVRDVERLYGGRFDPDELDFLDLSYETGEKNIFRVREKEKKWVEKQLYFVSDEYCRPFSLHYVAYGYNIAGRYKD